MGIFEDLTHICKEFQLGDLKEIAGHLGGFANRNIKIRTTKGIYVVRWFMDDIEESRLDYANKIIAILRNNDVPALQPILHRNNSSYLYYQSTKIHVTPFNPSLPFQWKPEQAYASGATLRKMHEILYQLNKSPRRTGVYKYYRLKPKRIRRKLRKENHQLPEIPNSKVNDLYSIIKQKEISFSNLPKTIIHGDWNPWNQLFNEKNKVSCVMDFDSLQKGVRIFDVAYALYFFCRKNQLETIGKAFLQGYGPITQEEVDILPVLIGKIGLFFAIFTDAEDFSLQKNYPFLVWVLSEEGHKRIRSFCQVTG